VHTNEADTFPFVLRLNMKFLYLNDHKHLNKRDLNVKEKNFLFKFLSFYFSLIYYE